MTTPIEMEYEEFLKLMSETTENLKRMTAATKRMRWQGIDEQTFNEFEAELEEARNGWVSSNCP